MITRARRFTVAVLAVAAIATPAAVRHSSGSAAASVRATPETWGGLPPLALKPEPQLPEPASWRFGDAFPRTSGTGRYAGGAYFWSDFLYDDHGAASLGTTQVIQTQAFGAYHYNEPQAAGNGADIFRAAVGLEPDASVWRVDWNTLLDPNLPIAAFAVDTDANPATGGTSWPANAGLTSPGIDKLLVLSAKTARLIDVPSRPAPLTILPGLMPAPAGAATNLPITVDVESRSFLVRVPRSLLPVSRSWTVRLAAGLADAAGTGFKKLDLAHGALPGQTNAYNVAFRDYDDEPQYANGWFEQKQASSLALTGDTASFTANLDWDRLSGGATEPEPMVKGKFVDRWFVSSIEPHQGITSGSNGGLSTNYYGNRVQPYAVYIPTTYTGEAPAPLTLVLHASSLNHNLERLVSPRFSHGACEARGSICVSPLGRGETLFWLDLAEYDFWEVWNRVATTFNLDPERTVIGGHSGGGSGAFNFTQDHPDLFAGFYIINSLDGTNDPEPHFYYDLAENLRWNPMYHMDSALDELPPIPIALIEIQRFEELGYRFVYDIHVVEDHFTPAIKDDYTNLIAWLGSDRVRERDPGHVTYRWYPHTVNRQEGWGPTGAWWVHDLDGRGGRVARVDAVSSAQPDNRVQPVITTTPNVFGGPSPSVRRQLEWTVDPNVPARAPSIDVALANVAAITLDLAGAGFQPGEAGTVNVATDGPVIVTIIGSGSTTQVAVSGGSQSIAVVG